jgi:predicted acetyltransferase
LSVDVELRAIAADELPAYLVVDSIGFGQPVERSRHNMAACELDRTVAAFERGRIVSVSRNYSFEITMPGGALLPAAGVSDVSVLPTHRRRGLLRSMMERLLDDADAHGEPVAMLTASEGGIYGRFGFGVAIRTSTVEVDARDAVFVGPPPPGTLRIVALDEARELEPGVFDRTRRGQPGAVSRFDAWWLDEQFQAEFGTRFDVVHESPDGSLDGYLTYGLRAQGTAHGPAYRLVFRELVAASPEATSALWQYACEVDLVRTVVAMNAPLDVATGWMLASPRAAKQNDIRDFLWTRLLDVPRALAARTYAAVGSGGASELVLEVHDAFRPGGRADGRFALEGGPEGASVAATASEPHLVLDVAALSAAWLGGVAFSTLARAGRVVEAQRGALARADAMFACTPLPVALTWF